ncbi:hypothetical protein BSFP_061470 [Burkholderia stabilis]|uniref:Uncharacterized protein n=1 Tax=Burkholderia stabilis TaxID=95485 RepID=A0A1Y1BYH2_9BURK|nr:hypothetical protein BSFP_061470 [Burkholderia stabilis]
MFDIEIKRFHKDEPNAGASFPEPIANTSSMRT